MHATTLDEQAPAGAFRFRAAGDLAVDAGRSADGRKSCPVRMLARTGDVITHYFWGRIVHDFDGMRHRERIPIDYDHEHSEPIGYVDTFEVIDGDLYLSGSIESVEPGDAADKLLARRAAGIPYQASIMFDPETLTVEFIDDYQVATVNGRTIEGPAVIARAWDLRGVAITPHGHDVATEAMFSSASIGAFKTWKGKGNMSKTTTPAPESVTKPDATTEAGTAPESKTEAAPQAETKTETAPAPSEAGNLSKTTPADDAAKYRQQAAEFTKNFGAEAGFRYFSKGLTMEQAAIEHCGKLSARLDETQQALDAANQRLAAALLSHGESDSIDTGKPAPKETPKTFAGLFSKAGSAQAAS